MRCLNRLRPRIQRTHGISFSCGAPYRVASRDCPPIVIDSFHMRDRWHSGGNSTGPSQDAAIAHIDRAATRPPEASSHSDNENARLERILCAGRIPQFAPPDFSFKYLEIGGLPLNNQDDDANPHPNVRRLRSEISAALSTPCLTRDWWHGFVTDRIGARSKMA